MDVEVDYELSRSHPFEIIKHKLYIRSPKHVADVAVTASQKVTQTTNQVDATALERKFFELEQDDIASRDKFGEDYASLRQMMVHPEASKKLREQINGRDEDYRGGRTAHNVARNNRTVGRFATVNSFARRSLDTARGRFRELNQVELPRAAKEIEEIRSSWYLAGLLYRLIHLPGRMSVHVIYIIKLWYTFKIEHTNLEHDFTILEPFA